MQLLLRRSLTRSRRYHRRKKYEHKKRTANFEYKHVKFLWSQHHVCFQRFNDRHAAFVPIPIPAVRGGVLISPFFAAFLLQRLTQHGHGQANAPSRGRRGVAVQVQI